MRPVNLAAQALLQRHQAGEQIPMVQLLEAGFSTTQRLTTAGVPLEWGGFTWEPIGVQIAPVEDEAGELTNLSLSLPAVNPQQIALALVEDVEGATLRVWDALVNPDSGVVADAILAWSGAFDVPAISDGMEATVSINAEHRGSIALRPKPSRYSNDEQQRLYPGDTSLNFDPGTDAARVVWPAASYFYK